MKLAMSKLLLSDSLTGHSCQQTTRDEIPAVEWDVNDQVIICRANQRAFTTQMRNIEYITDLSPPTPSAHAWYIQDQV